MVTKGESQPGQLEIGRLGIGVIRSLSALSLNRVCIYWTGTVTSYPGTMYTHALASLMGGDPQWWGL